MIHTAHADLVRRLTGMDLARLGSGAAARALASLARRLGTTASEVQVRAATDEAVAQALVDELVVPETWFLRYPESYAFLARWTREIWLPASGSRPLRILSLPCATGEEPYSIAMTLLDAGLEPHRYVIDAADLSPGCLSRARVGEYDQRALRSVTPKQLAAHFARVGDRHRVLDKLRASVAFHQVNIVGDDDDWMGRYDWAFCRNLLIYLSPANRHLALERLRRCLAADGVLALGHAEGISAATLGLQRVGPAAAFAYTTTQTGAAAPGDGAITPRRRAASPPRPAPVLGEHGRSRAPANVLPDAPLRPAPQPSAAPQLPELDEIRAACAAGSLVDAANLCEARLTALGPDAEAFVLLGVIAASCQSLDLAREHLRHALCLQPGHEEAADLLAALTPSAGQHTPSGYTHRRLR